MRTCRAADPDPTLRGVAHSLPYCLAEDLPTP